MQIPTALYFLIQVLLVTCEESDVQLDYGNDEYSTFLAQGVHLLNLARTDPELWAEMQRDQTIDQRIIEPVFPQFNCPNNPVRRNPSSVHELQPADVDVVIAFGDSVTAGNGIGVKRLTETFYVQNRGEAWSIGGDNCLDEGVITLPNILRKFNPELKGYSKCMSAQHDFRYAWMNVALPGSTSRNLLTQSQLAIDRLHGDPRIDAANDWKVITLLIGWNDMCRHCWDNDGRHLPLNYTADIEEALDMLQANLTRVFVNIVSMFNIGTLPTMTHNRFCDRFLSFGCLCVYNETYRVNVKHVQMEYYRLVSELVDSGRYDHDDFTVVVQPYMRDQVPPTDPETGGVDYSWLAADCFHPSRKMHQAMAIGLWNSMLTPLGQKPYVTESLDEYKCPSEDHPYFFTSRNSPGYSST